MNFLIDPYILAVPELTEGRADEYLESLYLWVSAISGGGDHRFWLSQALFEALSETQKYPNFGAIQRIEAVVEDKVYNVNSVLRACEPYLFMPPTFDELFINDTLYFEESQVLVIPAAIARRLPTEVANALQETLGIAALGSHMHIDPIFDSLAFATVPNGFEENVLQAQFESIDLDTNQKEFVSKEWEMFFSPDAIDDQEEINFIWQNTDRAIQWAKRRVEAVGLSTDDMATYSIGRRFNNSILETHMNRNVELLETLFIKILKCLCGHIPRSNVARGSSNHPIRRGRNSHAIVTRHGDGAEAWRLTIQGNWRLHYWLLEDGSIELANVEYGHTMHIES